MAPLRLSFACWDYDRVKALEDGRVKAEGIELNFLNLRYIHRTANVLQTRETNSLFPLRVEET